MQPLYLRKFPKQLATRFSDENCNTYEFQPPKVVQEQFTQCLMHNKLKEVISTLITQVVTKEEETKNQPASAPAPAPTHV